MWMKSSSNEQQILIFQQFWLLLVALLFLIRALSQLSNLHAWVV
jgi:hypothetical protein